MSKKKIVEFIGRIQDGGAETLVKDYALLLDKELFEVTVLCLDYNPKSNVYKTLEKNKVKIVSLYDPFPLLCRALARILGPKFVAFLLSRSIRNLQPDVVHIHLELLNFVKLAIKEFVGVKLLFTCHNPPELLIGNHRPLEKKACRYLLDNNNLQIIALHEQMAQEINEMFNINNTAVIKNGIDFNHFVNVEESKESIRKTLNIPDNSYVIGQVGRFTYQKNPEFTLNIFKQLLEKRPDSYLLMIGRGKQEKMIRDMIRNLDIEDHVLILKNRDDIPRLLKALDVFIFPSRFEGLGIVLIEAQVVGLPCVISDNIPKQAYQSPNITCLSLEEKPEVWVDSLLNPQGNISSWGNIEEYDMNKEIKNLEALYLQD